MCIFEFIVGSLAYERVVMMVGHSEAGGGDPVIEVQDDV